MYPSSGGYAEAQREFWSAPLVTLGFCHSIRKADFLEDASWLTPLQSDMSTQTSIHVSERSTDKPPGNISSYSSVMELSISSTFGAEDHRARHLTMLRTFRGGYICTVEYLQSHLPSCISSYLQASIDLYPKRLQNLSYGRDSELTIPKVPSK